MGGSVFINGVEYPQFDNCYKINIKYNNMLWNSSEQLYQSLKFSEKNHIFRINSEDDLGVIYMLGQNQKELYTNEYKLNQNETKINNMYISNKEKILQNSNLIRILIETDGDIVIYGNRFWGIKGKKGNNWLGKILHRIRDELKIK